MLDTVRAKRDDVYAIARKHKIGKVYVFGSCARREETPDSDVDFLVEFDEGASLLDQVHARDDLRDVFRRDVDVVSRRGLSPYMGSQILAEAVAIWANGNSAETYDLVVYGSSPAAISAAVQAKRMGKRAVIVSPETRIGGLTTGGLGQTDIGNKAAFGGIALEFYRAVADYYRDEKNWTREKRGDYLPDGQCAGSKGEDSMWTFEPSAALGILEGWEKRDGLVIRRGKRLDRSKGKVKVEGEGEQRRIVSFLTEDGTEYRGKMFVDATYEGDLLAAAGCTYTVGREANSTYGETLNGVQTEQAIDAGCAVQDLPYPPLARRLLADGQILAFKAPR